MTRARESSFFSTGVRGLVRGKMTKMGKCGPAAALALLVVGMAGAMADGSAPAVRGLPCVCAGICSRWPALPARTQPLARARTN